MSSHVKRRIAGLLACLLAGLVLGAVAYLVVIGIPFGPQAKGDLEMARSDRPGQRVLFIGNSFTYYNDMPSMVSRLAADDPAASTLFVAQYTAPGWDLRRASSHEGLRKLLEEVRWSDVVLQERSDERVPFFHDLHGRVRVLGGRTVIVDLGDGGAGAYAGIARSLEASLAPVWSAWKRAMSERPSLNLFADDENHPNRAGSFLIACVFYSVLTDRNPAESRYTAELSGDEAAFIKAVAWNAYRSMRS
jgi:hypothetical protein